MAFSRPNRRSTKVLFRFTVSYLLLMMIPLLMGLVAYTLAVRNATEQVIRTHELALERAASEVECSISEVRSFSERLMTLEPLARLFDESRNEEQLIPKLQEVIGSLPECHDTYGMVQRYFVYVPDSRVIVDNKNAYINLQKYYASTFRYGDMELDAFEALLSGDGALGLRAVTRNVYLQKEYQSMLYISRFISPNRHVGKTVFYLDEAVLLKRLQMHFGTEAEFVGIYSGNGEPLLSTGDGSISGEIIRAVPAGRQVGSFRLDQPDSIVSFYHSDALNVTMTIALPQAFISDQLSGVRSTMFFGMGLMLLIGAACAVTMLYKNRKPLAAAIDSLPSLGQDEDQTGLWWLEASVKSMMDNREKLENSLRLQRMELQNAAIHQLIQGGAKAENELESLLEYVGIRISGEWNCGVYIRIGTGEPWNGEMTPNGDLRRTKLISALSEMEERLIFLGLQNQNTCAMVYTGTEGEEIDLTVFQRLYQRLIDMGETGAIISIGSRHHRLVTLHRSFDLAAQQLERVEEGSWLLIGRTGGKEHEYHYTDLDEQRLGNLAANNRAEELDEALNHVWKENFVTRNITGLERELLYYRLVDTLTKASDEPVLTEEEHLRFNKMSAEEFFRIIRRKFHQIGERMEQKRRESSDQLLQSVLRYLEEHFTEYETCLSSTAMAFGLTEKYLSAFFKEKTGTNFSNWLENLRMRKADELLRDSALSVEEIAKAIGYNSAKTFSRAYYRCTGQTPTQARKGMDTSAAFTQNP